MPRLQLTEIEDLAWCPTTVRDYATGYLRYIISLTDTYRVAAPLLVDALKRCGTSTILDLCSGAGGPWLRLQDQLRALGYPVQVTLTDRYPNSDAMEYIERLGRTDLHYSPIPTDARTASTGPTVLRTLCTSFHHFSPEDAQAILAAAVASGDGIAVLEVTERSLRALCAILPTPLFAWIGTPWIRPFRWSRLFLTYCIPLVPLLLLFDGIVSICRSYTSAELLELARAADPASDYEWSSGQRPVPFTPMNVTYLIGVPREKKDGRAGV